MKMNKLIFQAICCIVFGLSAVYVQAEIAFKWNKIEFESLPQSPDTLVGPDRYYIPENIDIVGLGLHSASGLMFAVLARIRPGVPATIAAFCLSEHKIGSSPKLWAFPNFVIQTLRTSDFYGQSFRSNARRFTKKPIYNQGINFYDWNSQYGGNYPSHHYLYQKPIYSDPSTLYSQATARDFRIISTYQVVVDEKCNRAFFLDTGMVLYANVSSIIQNPALVVYDLPVDGCETRNFRLIRRIEFPDKLAKMGPFSYYYMTLDFQSNQCDDLFIYIGNFFEYFLVVLDYKKNEFWYFNDNPTFRAVTAESHFIYDKTLNFVMESGIYSVFLDYPDKSGDRTAYYVDGGSTVQYAVSTKVLKNKKKSPQNYNKNDFKLIGHRGCNTQTAATVVDYTYGVVFYAELQSKRITCWNMRKPLNPDNIGVVFESEKLSFPFSIIIDSSGYLWFNSGNLVYLYFTTKGIDINKTNMYYFRIKVSDAIRGTVCEY
ncbi:L-dopachrome tautomerase yellow-f2-like [Lutzomyia longipalpis]|uniref:L-dopachrome tautomerase yellow-f2-like n=1 Tax=Lutzomyia longipalpis TaxID=7200 RepID=UPI0024835A0A|nr:L-dopachrome tautomerase yellow-f2-like [Lutzomyia longipalpis]